MIKTPKSSALAGVNIENLRGKAQGVTMQPHGQTHAAPAKPSSKVPSPIPTTKVPGMAKPAGKKPSAKVKDAAFIVTPYGTTRPGD